MKNKPLFVVDSLLAIDMPMFCFRFSPTANDIPQINNTNLNQLMFYFSRYEGEWAEGIKQGNGKYTFGSGDVFTGTYENNVRHGEGKLVKVEGEERSEN